MELERREGKFFGEALAADWAAAQHILKRLGIELVFTDGGLEVPALPDPSFPNPGTKAWRFLEAVVQHPDINSSELEARLETDHTQISRTGRALLEKGHVTKRKAGSFSLWHATELGVETIGREAT